MPSWNEIHNEVKAAGGVHDVIRRKYLEKLHDATGRNIIVYYSGWLEKPELLRQGVGGFDLNDSDKNGFMTTIHGLDRSKGLDLLLHTPGGEFAATESLVDYLRSMFGTDMRAVIPQIALSAGTMVACACKEIIMGKHSSLGPIDPQMFGLPAHGVIEEFERVRKEIQQNRLNIPLWQPIIAKYNPTLIGECEKAIAWSTETVQEWLRTGMFKRHKNAADKAKRVVAELGDHALTKSHARHISMKGAKGMGLKTTALENDEDLQDAVMSVHHACIQTLSATDAIKIIENHLGRAHIKKLSAVIVPR